MRGLKARLDSLARRRAETQRYVAVLPDMAGAPGSVVPLADGRTFRLYVPREFAGDPMAGLDERQRAFLRRGDCVIARGHVARDGRPATFYEAVFSWPDDRMRFGPSSDPGATPDGPGVVGAASGPTRE
jgi:hypothetical protein